MAKIIVKSVTPNPEDSSGPSDYHLRVYQDKSILVLAEGNETPFVEGANNAKTKARYKNITTALENGFLIDQIRFCKNNPQDIKFDLLSDEDRTLIDGLVDSMTSEVGRALVGLSVLQITVKAIQPDQSIRLHKGGSSAKNFGWQDGISMRTLDAGYITPVLRDEGLVKLNAFGFMMTRTLAENYPYTRVYKAAMRGARDQWIGLVEGLETGRITPLPALHSLISKLLNNAQKFEDLAATTIDGLDKLTKKGAFSSHQAILSIIKQHMNDSNYAARIMEIAMHSLMQALKEMGILGGLSVVSLSQMRSANKKHGNIGDIELLDGNSITESWDAKYGKTYLRDELEELNDKLEYHSELTVAGFVTSEKPQQLKELQTRIDDIEELHGICIKILSLDEWVMAQIARCEDKSQAFESDVSSRWIRAYTECLAQKRPLQAPIDEPCFQWLSSLNDILLRIKVQK